MCPPQFALEEPGPLDIWAPQSLGYAAGGFGGRLAAVLGSRSVLQPGGGSGAWRGFRLHCNLSLCVCFLLLDATSQRCLMSRFILSLQCGNGDILFYHFIVINWL